jgi:hypothetical protein
VSTLASLVEYLAQRPEMLVALCLLVVVAMVLAERMIRPTEVREG